MPGLSIFIGALAVAYLVPGADMLLLLQTGARQGRRHALATALGLAMARAAHVALAALGLAALLRTAPAVFDLVRIAGAAYLVWLGIGVLRMPPLSPAAAGGAAGPQAGRGAASYLADMLRGLLTNLLNPKALLFCSVLLPQFIQTEAGGVSGQFAMLGAILVGVGMAFDSLYALAGAALAGLVARHRVVEAVQRWSFAALLIGFGVRLAAVQRL
ncbi:LysE family translocator [Azospirillum sp. A26]|uniref:LysE family translocator n=1 Tax=Azospirillum sp. A26 TaxID=3160607 RepID=UPI00366B8928